jgi:hypothetical protein
MDHPMNSSLSARHQRPGAQCKIVKTNPTPNSDPASRRAARPSRYNRNVKGSTVAGVALGIAIALLSGCKKDIQSKEAVRQGVMTYLAKRSDLLSMDVNVTSVDFKNDQATATVRFQAKGNNSPAGSMTMQYVLERKSDQWVVKGRAGSGNPHGGMPQEGAGSMGAMPQTMPPGHPSVGDGGAPPQALPPGHPVVGDAK